MEPLHRLLFKFGGNASAYLGKGWSTPESDFTWATGLKSEIRIPISFENGRILLTIRLLPLVWDHLHQEQRLQLHVNGHEIASEALQRGSTIVAFVPDAAVSGESDLYITLNHPDAFRVSDVLPVKDDRQLSFAVRFLRLDRIEMSQTTLLSRGINRYDVELPEDRILLDSFESLGDNCEFGLVQRRLGSDPLGLLRFSAVSLNTLFELLHSRFSDIANEDQVEVEAHALASGDYEYLIYHSQYNLRYHTFSLASQFSRDQVIRREVARLRLASRMLLERLKDGSRILVYKHTPDLRAEHLYALWLAVRDFGPNTLLFVSEETQNSPAGTVEIVCDGLLRGFVSAYAPYDDAGGGDDASWLMVCKEAYRIWQGSKLNYLC